MPNDWCKCFKGFYGLKKRKSDKFEFFLPHHNMKFLSMKCLLTNNRSNIISYIIIKTNRILSFHTEQNVLVI